MSKHPPQRPWTHNEVHDAQTLGFAEFAVKYPDRTYTAWTNARLRARKQPPRVHSNEQVHAGLVRTLQDLDDQARRSAQERYEQRVSGQRDTFFLTSNPAPAPYAANTSTPLTTPGPWGTQATMAMADEFTRQHSKPHLDAPTPKAPHDPEKQVIRYQDFEADGDISDADFLDAFISWQKARNAKFSAQAQLEHRLRISTADDGKPIAIAFPSDWHLGNAGVDHARIVSDVDLICSHPRLFCALGGDPIDNFIIDKMIAASRSQLAQVDAQWVMFRALVNKLSDSGSLLFVGSGNHDQWTERLAGVDGITSALRGKQVLNTGEGGYIEVEVGAQSYGIYRKHKPTRFNSHYNPTHFLKQMLRMGTPWDFDIGVSEHFHNCNIEMGEHRPGTGRDRLFITTGSYKIKDPYAEGLGYYGGGYGVPVVVLFPDRKEMQPFKRLSQAISVLDAACGIRTHGGAA